MTHETKLLPCPFCGVQAVATDEMFGSVIHCDHLHTCPLDGHEKFAAAVHEWNSRATPTEDVRAMVDEPEVVAIVESALRRSFTLGQVYWQQADSDSTRQQNKSDQTMETQSNHIAMVVKSIKSLIK